MINEKCGRCHVYQAAPSLIWTKTLQGSSTVTSGIPEPPTLTHLDTNHTHVSALFIILMLHLLCMCCTSPLAVSHHTLRLNYSSEYWQNVLCRGALFTRFVVHDKNDVGPLSDHSKEFHHTRRSEGTPRTHLLTAEPLQGNLGGWKKRVSNQSKPWNQAVEKT